MTTRTSDIKIDQRHAMLTKAVAIGDIYDALVEIITNCNDSYHRLYNNTGRNREGGDIFIKIENRRGGKSRVIVSDKAEGLTDKDMLEKLGRTGGHTSEKGDRGFMGRGIKDCTALGNIEVHSIVDGRLYACELTMGNKIITHPSTDVDNSTRKSLGIRKNGTVVTLNCTRLPRYKNIREDLPLHYALRDILDGKSSSKVRISDGKNGGIILKSSGDLYAGTPVFDETLSLDKYPKAECHLKIWKHESKLKLVDKRLRTSGVLVQSESAIYQCSLFKYENDEHAEVYSGKLVCNYIDNLRDEFDRNLGNEQPSNNPMFIIDPSRKGGLTQEHPFTKALTEKINSALGGLLAQDRAKENLKTGDVANEETRKRLSKLAQAANRLWKDNFDDADLSADAEQAIDGATNAGIYILPPKFKISEGEERTLTVYINKQYYDASRKVRVHSSNENAIALVKTFSKKKPQKHPKRNNIFYGSIRISGKAIGESTITVRPNKDTACSSVGDVVSKREPGDDHVFAKNSILEFERKSYKILEGKEKILKIFADISKIKTHDVKANISSNKPNVVVLGGTLCPLTPSAHNYASGDVRVKGQDITERNRPAIITAKIGSAVAQTTVRVVEKQYMDGGFEFKVVNEDLGQYRARWDIENPNLFKMSAVHPSLKSYFGDKKDKFPGQNAQHGKALIAELVTEGVCVRILRQEMKDRRGGYKFDGEEPQEVLDQIMRELQDKISKFSTQAHKIMQAD